MSELRFDPNVIPVGDVDLGVRLGLPAEGRVAHRAMRNALLANLRLAQLVDPGNRVYYSRDVAHYANARRHVPASYTRRVVVEVVEQLVDSGGGGHHQTLPSAQATRRSTVWLLPGLGERLGLDGVHQLAWRLRDPIILKDSDGELLRYASSARIRTLRRDVEAQNEVLSSLTITLHDPAWTLDRHGLHRDGRGRVVNPCRVILYRVFNDGRWTHGGRWYGGFWQQLPGTARRLLRIDGCVVIEEDFRGCHLRLMSACAGVPEPSGDPYALEAVVEACGDARLARKVAKTAFQILVNTTSLAQAYAAIRGKIESLGGPEPCTSALVVSALKQRYPEFAHLWHSGLGVRLQRIDSDMAALVMCRLRAQGAPTLPVHDSFIVRLHDRDLLLKAMDEAFALGMARARALR